MKKLLTIVVLASVALAANAATMTWNMSGIKTPSSAEVAASDGWLALFFTVAGDITTDAVAEDFTKGVFDAVSSATATAETSGGKVSKKGIGDYAAGSQTTVFAVVFDAATAADATNFLITPAQTKTFAANGANATTTFNVASASWTAIAGSDNPDQPDVPEPATGALALAGVALLFRRRR